MVSLQEGTWRAALTLFPARTVRSTMLVSALYDLRAPRLSSRSSYVKFDDATEDTPSPQRHIDEIHLPLVVAYASMDAPEFQRQSIEFSVALRAARRPVEIVVCTNYNHFEALETLANPYGILGRAALRMMNLG